MVKNCFQSLILRIATLRVLLKSIHNFNSNLHKNVNFHVTKTWSWQLIFLSRILYIFLPELFLKRIKNFEIFGEKPKFYQLYRNFKNKINATFAEMKAKLCERRRLLLRRRPDLMERVGLITRPSLAYYKIY